MLAEFPAPGQIEWQRFDTEKEIKLASSVDANFGTMTRAGVVALPTAVTIT